MKDLNFRVNSALQQIRPYLENDGGDIELIEITSDFIVRLKLLGACKSCSMSTMTMKAGVEEAIRKMAPEIISVEAVTDDLFAI